jgi:hypothetical protein
MNSLSPVPSGPKKTRSPWMWVGLGCGLTALLAFGGCVALMGFVGQRAAREMSKPITQTEAMAKLGDVPIYQPSAFNEIMTKGVRFGSSLFPGEMVSAVAFDTNDSPEKIMSWYQQKLSQQGFQEMPKQPTLNRNTTQANFQKGSQSILVQIQDSDRGAAQKYSLILMRMKLPAP